MKFALIDWLFLASFFAVLLEIPLWCARRNKGTSSDFFKGGGRS